MSEQYWKRTGRGILEARSRDLSYHPSVRVTVTRMGDKYVIQARHLATSGVATEPGRYDRMLDAVTESARIFRLVPW